MAWRGEMGGEREARERGNRDGVGVRGGSRERGCMYTYILFMLLYSRNYNTVKQLYSN